ncbi:MAG: M20 family metallopeptidase [Candidatus Thorarchaeota archaeon]
MDIKNIVNEIDQELIIRLTKEMIRMDSQNPPGHTSHIVQYLKKEFSKFGFKAEIIELDDKRHNIIVSFGSGDQDIVLCGHLDTVPIGDISNWQDPPLDGIERDGKIIGRGSADMLGGVATLIAVMELLSRSNIKLNKRIVFLGTADEEVGMHGAFQLQKKGFMDNACCLIITEATSMRVGIAEKGPYWIRVKVKGKAAHGSLPEYGINAIEGAFLAIQRIKSILPKEQHSLLGKSTLNVGLISGGTKINVVPDECHFDCDFRLIPGINQKEFDLKIKQLLKELSNECPHTFSHELIHVIPALNTDSNEKIIQNLLKWSNNLASLPLEPIGLTYGTDAAALIPPRNIPFAIIGGGSASVLHQANEYVQISELLETAKIITAAIIETFGEKK